MRLIVDTRRENDLHNLVGRENEGVFSDVEVVSTIGAFEDLDEGRDFRCEVADIVNVPLGFPSSLMVIVNITLSDDTMIIVY